MKIYCLLLDAVPWGAGNPSDAGSGRRGGLAGIAERGGLTGFTQVFAFPVGDALIRGIDIDAHVLACAQITAGLFTTTTLLSMFSGRLPSDIVPGGVGYLSHQEDRYYRWMEVDRQIHLLDSPACFAQVGWLRSAAAPPS